MSSKKSDICQQALHGYTLSYIETMVNCSSIQNASGRKKKPKGRENIFLAY